MNNFGFYANVISGDNMEHLFPDIEKNIENIEKDFEDCSDFLLRECETGGEKCFFAVMDGLVNSLQLSQMVMEPVLLATVDFKSPAQHYQQIKTKVVHPLELNEAETFEDMYYYLMSGFCVFMLDGHSTAMIMGVQGWQSRGTDEPSNESNVKGAKECFVETLNDNKALLRKRAKTHHLKYKQITLGTAAPTPVVIAYIDDRADKKVVREVEHRLVQANLNTIPDYGVLIPFLDTDIKSFFSTVGATERPDVLASKLYEGRVAVMIEGSPFVIYVPLLFSDNFQSLDDYDAHPFYGGFIRILKYFSFGVSVFLPGLYVALSTYHQELIPTNLLYIIASAEARTPFVLTLEAILTLILYEIMREAGLRLPKTIGHAVSIIGALVIGDAIVSAGIIGAPMLVIIAVTAISSYVTYSLYESVSFLRLVFILVGGITGIYGIMLGGAALFVNICTLNSFGVPLSAPISPITKQSAGDIFFRESWKTLSKRKVRVQDMRGVSIDES